MEKLKEGDKIGLIAPSGNPKSQEDINEIAEIIKKYNFIPVFSPNLLVQQNKEKIEDIHKFFNDKDIKAIFTLRGGFSCNEILDSIDYSLIEKNKKLFVGFSDITNLLVTFNKKSNLKTIHGPIFSEKKYLDEALLNDVFSFFKGETTSNDIFTKMKFEILKNSEKTSGDLIGGNLFVLNNLIGTDYEPSWENKVLFIESVGLSKEIIISIIYHFKQLGIFEKINGLILGNMGYSEDISKEILKILSFFKGFILQTKKFGHVNINYPIILGEMVEWDENNLRKID